MSTFFQGLLLGLILGWIIEWIIDWWFWRGDASGGGQIGYSQDFTRITGINSDYDGRLKGAGISTYSALAGSSPSTVRSAIGGSESSSIDAEAWIVEAGNLSGSGAGASGSAGGSANLATSLAGSGSAGAATATAPKSSGASKGSGAGASGAGKGAGAATATAPKSSGAGKGSGAGASGAGKGAGTGTSAGASAANRSTSGAGAGGDRKDDLTKIHGVGKVFQSKFYDAGYTTWAQVSKLSDAEIREVIQPEEWQKIDTDVWIEDARILAGGGTPPKRASDSDSSSSSSSSSGASASPSKAASSGSGRGRGRRTDRDDLTKIHGIGRVYQGRFNDVGVFFWSEVADLSEERIREIINPEEWQKIEPLEWKSEARQFAAEKGGDA